MSDWQVGDLAVCVNAAPFVCRGQHGTTRHGGKMAPPEGKVLRVVSIYRALNDEGAPCRCGCFALKLDNGSSGVIPRFRKAVSDKREACEPEFVTLLQRIKRKEVA